jgi:hypothetical protein
MSEDTRRHTHLKSVSESDSCQSGAAAPTSTDGLPICLYPSSPVRSHSLEVVRAGTRHEGRVSTVREADEGKSWDEGKAHGRRLPVSLTKFNHPVNRVNKHNVMT